MFVFNKSKIQGCFELQPKIFEDARGKFVKTFHEKEFSSRGLETKFEEEYYSTSNKNVIRGLHFQLPPVDHVKLVYCVEGEVLDVVVDLRVGSPTFGQFEMFELTALKANCIYIPKGMAHGFCVKSEKAILVYKVSTVYDSYCDAGIHWNSVGIKWGANNPILSVRDQGFPKFNEFVSPFSYE